jgi:DNA-binding LytR/AlgR family response regulator
MEAENEEKLRVLIVDDEALARRRLRRLLEGATGVQAVGEAGSAPEACAAIAAATWDVLLLDIQMPGEDGFALLRSLERPMAVVFVTAYDAYAVRAFEERAQDYLLKPCTRERLLDSLDRVRAARRDPELLVRRLEEVLRTLEHVAKRPGGLGSSVDGATAETRLDRFRVGTGSRQAIVKAAEVLWFGTEGKLVVAVTDSGRHFVEFTLDVLERRLDPRTFLRVHRSAIVNLDHAGALHPASDGAYRLVLDDPARTEVPVSRTRARALRERLGA